MEIKVNQIFRAKNPSWVVSGEVNDRQVVYVDEHTVQYDSPAIKNGMRYKRIPRAEFEAWIGEDVTGTLPDGRWLDWEDYLKLKRSKK